MIPRHGVEASSEVLFDNITEGIAGLARSRDARLIVMGPRRAEDVLRRTTTPLCVIRHPPTGKVYRRALVPVVDDDLSAMTIDFGQAFDAELLCCTVLILPAAKVSAQILHNVRAEQCDVIIMASHARDGLVLRSQEPWGATSSGCTQSEYGAILGQRRVLHFRKWCRSGEAVTAY